MVVGWLSSGQWDLLPLSSSSIVPFVPCPQSTPSPGPGPPLSPLSPISCSVSFLLCSFDRSTLRTLRLFWAYATFIKTPDQFGQPFSVPRSSPTPPVTTSNAVSNDCLHLRLLITLYRCPWPWPAPAIFRRSRTPPSPLPEHPPLPPPPPHISRSHVRWSP